jgi:sporulation protein YlmC with PRC-barrel domain
MGASGGASAALSPASLQEIKDDSAIVSSFDMNVKKLKGMDIVGADGKKIGEVDKVLGDSSNQAKAVTVDFGGFLGIGASEVIVPFDRLSKGAKDDELKTSMSKDELKNLTKYEAKRDAGATDRGVATGSGGQPATSVPAR